MNEILQLSPPVLLAVALYLVGMALKKTPLPSWSVPPILIVIGAAAFPFIADRSKINFECKNPEVLNMIYGAAIGGLALGLKEMITGFLARKGIKAGESGDTTVTTKPPTETK